MGGKSRKSGGVSSRLIANLKAGIVGTKGKKGGSCGSSKTKNKNTLFDIVPDDEGPKDQP
jgi:hypothetical protein